MKRLLVLLVLLSGCASADRTPEPEPACEVSNLALVIADPFAYRGKWFCGEAFAFPQPGRPMRLFPEPPTGERTAAPAAIYFGEASARQPIPVNLGPGGAVLKFNVRGRIGQVDSCADPDLTDGDRCIGIEPQVRINDYLFELVAP